MFRRSDARFPRHTAGFSKRLTLFLTRSKLLRALRVSSPIVAMLAFTGVIHAQGTMDFSGATTLMQTFKTLAAFLRRADEGTLSRLLVETAILMAAARTNPASVLKEAASVYKVDTEAIAAKVKQEFAAKASGKKEAKKTRKAA